MIERLFTKITAFAADWAGRPVTFIWSIVLIALWGCAGPYLHYSDTWQLMVNTPTTVMELWLALLIQATVNRSDEAIQTKLDELIWVDNSAHKKIVGIEKLTLTEIQKLHREIEQHIREMEKA